LPPSSAPADDAKIDFLNIPKSYTVFSADKKECKILRNITIEIPKSLRSERILCNETFCYQYSATDELSLWVSYELRKFDAPKAAVKKTTKTSRKSKPAAVHSDLQYDDVCVDSVAPKHYKNSGYEMSALMPNQDGKYSHRALRASYMMSNMTPQKSSLMAGAWKNIEEFIRKNSAYYSRTWVVSGPVIVHGLPRTMYGIVIPQKFFKVVLSEASDKSLIAYGFLLSQDAHGSAESFLVPVDRIQIETGYNFFSVLPQKIRDNIVSRLPVMALTSK
jgi:endonuclease G